LSGARLGRFDLAAPGSQQQAVAESGKLVLEGEDDEAGSEDEHPGGEHLHRGAEANAPHRKGADHQQKRAQQVDDVDRGVRISVHRMISMPS
jgi:hypothetical protein